MGYLIGTDEAGYGPNLGPLLVTATLWSVPDDPVVCDLYRMLSPVVVGIPVVTGDVAIEVGTWRQRGRLREEPPGESAGRYLVVWRRLPDGRWKMQFDSWTAPFPED